ncbi:hypothetical protein SAMN05443428_104186 [Caloramator quimbayensis]|uniref:DUF2953 domain-containing protein n=1 Tax=Caloramator quimbayensis TaxID=1147123 RepID=A0A1T4WYN2_9CLOT|nr:hypothetical protein [Caloramator quimbayensis]SKA82277.1 hypothetical protein SAMN05443428_104186 [Caloramator quimbayensis]
MGIIVLAVISVVILFFLLSTIIFSIYVGRDKKVVINIILFKVIKIKINDKNKKRKKNKGLKINIPPKIILKILKESLPPVKYLIEKSRLYIKLDMTFGLSSPDKTAITYGLINSFIYTLDCFLKSSSKKVDSSYNIVPDLKDKRIDVFLDFKISIRILNVFSFLFKLLRIFLHYKSNFKFKGGVVYGASN